MNLDDDNCILSWTPSSFLAELIKDGRNFMFNKSSKLKANHFAIARHNCTHIKNEEGIIINQSHKSQRLWNVIKWRKNVSKSCMHAKSLNNDKKKKGRRHWWLSSRNGSLLLSHLCTARLNQLVRFEGILIFITAMSQQGVCWNIAEFFWDISIFLVPTGITSIRSNLLSMKITIFLLTTFSFLIFQFYSGSITSSILQAQPDSIKTLRDLIDSDKLQLAVEDIIYSKDFFNVCILWPTQCPDYQTWVEKFQTLLLNFLLFINDQHKFAYNLNCFMNAFIHMQTIQAFHTRLALKGFVEV